jgi:threonine aldolase
VISIENTLWGTIHSQSSIVEISKWAKEYGLKMHLDGARLWHVAVETGMSMKELCEPFDTVSLCFSKGLGTFCEPNVTLFQKYLIDTK